MDKQALKELIVYAQEHNIQSVEQAVMMKNINDLTINNGPLSECTW